MIIIVKNSYNCTCAFGWTGPNWYDFTQHNNKHTTHHTHTQKQHHSLQFLWEQSMPKRWRMHQLTHYLFLRLPLCKFSFFFSLLFSLSLLSLFFCFLDFWFLVMPIGDITNWMTKWNRCIMATCVRMVCIAQRNYTMTRILTSRWLVIGPMACVARDMEDVRISFLFLFLCFSFSVSTTQNNKTTHKNTQKYTNTKSTAITM